MRFPVIDEAAAVCCYTYFISFVLRPSEYSETSRYQVDNVVVCFCSLIQIVAEQIGYGTDYSPSSCYTVACALALSKAVAAYSNLIIHKFDSVVYLFSTS